MAPPLVVRARHCHPTTGRVPSGAREVVVLRAISHPYPFNAGLGHALIN